MANEYWEDDEVGTGDEGQKDERDQLLEKQQAEIERLKSQTAKQQQFIEPLQKAFQPEAQPQTDAQIVQEYLRKTVDATLKEREEQQLRQKKETIAEQLITTMDSWEMSDELKNAVGTVALADVIAGKASPEQALSGAYERMLRGVVPTAPKQQNGFSAPGGFVPMGSPASVSSQMPDIYSMPIEQVRAWRAKQGL
jgi:hypothetical protein